MAKIKNLELTEAEHWIFRMAARDGLGEPIDLTDGSAAWAIGIEDGATVLTVSGSIVDAEDGVVDFIVTPTTHVAVTHGEYIYEMRVTLASDVVSSQIRGRLTVIESP